MRHSVPSLFSLAAGCLGVCALQLGLPPGPVIAAPATDSSSAISGKRWVKIDLEASDASGEIQVGKPVELSLAIGGVAQGSAPLVAICESVLFERQLVTLEPDDLPMVMKGS